MTHDKSTPRLALEAAVEAVAENTRGIRAVTGCEVKVQHGQSDDRGAALRLNLVVEYGSDIQATGEKVTENIRQALFRISGLGLSDVRLEVEGVHLPESVEERAEEGE